MLFAQRLARKRRAAAAVGFVQRASRGDVAAFDGSSRRGSAPRPPRPRDRGQPGRRRGRGPGGIRVRLARTAPASRAGEVRRVVRADPRQHGPLHVRRRGSVRPISIDRQHVGADGSENRAPGRNDPALEGSTPGTALSRAIERLIVDQRTILALHHLEDRPVTESPACSGSRSGPRSGDCTQRARHSSAPWRPSDELTTDSLTPEIRAAFRGSRDGLAGPRARREHRGLNPPSTPAVAPHAPARRTRP